MTDLIPLLVAVLIAVAAFAVSDWLDARARRREDAARAWAEYRAVASDWTEELL